MEPYLEFMGTLQNSMFWLVKVQDGEVVLAESTLAFPWCQGGYPSEAERWAEFRVAG